MSGLLRIAARNVLRNRRRSALTAAAIVLGIGALVSVRGFTNGFYASIISNQADAKLGALQVHHPRYLSSQEQAPLELDLPGDEAFLSKIAAVPGVVAVAPRITFTSAVSLGEETTFSQLVAVDPVREPKALRKAREAVVEGRPIEGRGECLLSTELARTLRAKVGDTVTFLASDRDGVLNGAEARLVGLLAFKTPGDRKVAQLSLADADELLRMNGRITEVAVAVDVDLEGSGLQRIREGLQAALPGQVSVATWAEIATFLADMLVFQRVLYAVVSVVFVIIVLTGIANTMLMSVLERVREIGTMMALGIRRRQIVRLFLAESGVLGLVGGACGAAAGSLVVLAMNQVGLDMPPVGTDVPNIVRPTIGLGYNLFAVALSTVGAVLAAIYPAWRASKLRPVEALTHV